MNCHPKPEVTCGDRIPDSCVPVTLFWPACFPGENDCPRQSEWNKASSDLICSLVTSVGKNPTSCIEYNGTGILGSIYLGCLSSTCDEIVPVKTTVRAEFQNIYDVLCGIKVDLNLPVPGLDLKCLAIPCDPAVPTLGQVLQAMIDAICCIGCVVPDASGCIDCS